MSKRRHSTTKRQRYRQTVARFMDGELPTIAEQKQKLYRPTIGQVEFYYRLLNHLVFDDKLTRPYLIIRRIHAAWGLCVGHQDLSCEIHITDRFYCKQWFLIVLAHEMCHQYQWQIQGAERLQQGRKPIMSHGPSFFVFKNRLLRLGIPLKIAFRTGRWFRLQDFHRA